MSNTNQQSRIEQNLQMVLIKHQDKILSEIFTSAEMNNFLLESKQKIQPHNFLPIIFKTLLEDETFLKQNHFLLSQENLSEENQKIVLNNLMEGRVLDFLKLAWRMGRGALDYGKDAIQQYYNRIDRRINPPRRPLIGHHRKATYIRNPSGVGGKWRFNQGTSVNPYHGLFVPGEYVVDPDTGREVWRLIPGVKPSDFGPPPGGGTWQLEEDTKTINEQEQSKETKRKYIPLKKFMREHYLKKKLP